MITCEHEEANTLAPCYLEEWVKDTPAQQFFYDIETGMIKDGALGYELCNLDGKLNLCNPETYKQHTNWRYDGVSQTLKHLTDFGASFPYVSNTKKWTPVLMDAHQHQDDDPTLNINSHFRIEYCYKDK